MPEAAPKTLEPSDPRRWVRGSGWIWLSAGAISLGLLGVVVAQIDWGTAAAMLDGLAWPYVAGAICLLLAEGVVTSIRIWIFSARKPALTAAIRANAWYVVLLVLLPARLGEVAAVFVFQNHLGQKPGAASMSVVAQRLYDVACLGAVFLIALAGLGDAIPSGILAVIAAGLLGGAAAALVRLDFLLSLGARWLLGMKLHRQVIVRPAVRLVLQARTWNRHMMSRKEVPMAVATTLLKWGANLGALACLLSAVGLGLPVAGQFAIATAYNFLAIIPVQTIGGFGVGEAGLSLLLIASGIAVPVAASASVLMRLVLVCSPFLFFLLVHGLVRIGENVRNEP